MSVRLKSIRSVSNDLPIKTTTSTTNGHLQANGRCRDDVIINNNHNKNINSSSNMNDSNNNHCTDASIKEFFGVSDLSKDGIWTEETEMNGFNKNDSRRDVGAMKENNTRIRTIR